MISAVFCHCTLLQHYMRLFFHLPLRIYKNEGINKTIQYSHSLSQPTTIDKCSFSSISHTYKLYNIMANVSVYKFILLLPVPTTAFSQTAATGCITKAAETTCITGIAPSIKLFTLPVNRKKQVWYSIQYKTNG